MREDIIDSDGVVRLVVMVGRLRMTLFGCCPLWELLPRFNVRLDRMLSERGRSLLEFVLASSF
jgi:hypothetical protein